MNEEAGRYRPKEDYRMVTTHAHLIDKMYFFGKQRERYLRERDFAGILIEGEDRRLLFQLRDNNLNIKNRNCWSLFGGGIHKNEEPIEAALRELKEELGFTVKREQLQLWISFTGFKKKNYLFKLRLNEDIKSLKLREGASFRYFKISEILKKRNVIMSLRLLLLLYPIISLIRSVTKD